MKIKCAVTGETLDTDKMPDLQAEVLEMMQKNVEMFCKYKIPFLLISGNPYMADKKSGPISFNFNENQEDLKNIMNMLNGMIVTLDLPYKLFRIEAAQEE